MQKKKLYYTPNSPYARVARVAARMSGIIQDVEEIEVTTRNPDTSYFEITPIARVPVFADGDIVLADTRDICAHFDELSGEARWFGNEDQEARFLRHIVQGFFDGVAVWLRENYRPADQRSEDVKAYEEVRARRALEWLEARWDPTRPCDFTSLLMACSFDIAVDRGLGGEWSALAPNIAEWSNLMAEDHAMRETRPLAAH